MTATHGNRAQLLLTSTPNVSISNLALTDTGDHLTYKIGSSDEAKRYWDRTATFVFQQSSNGSSWSTVTPSSVQYVGGYVTFASAVGGTDQARINSGAYLPYAAIGDVLEWAPELSRDTHETTCMTTTSTPTRWKTYKGGLLGGSFKIGRFLVDDTYLGLITVTTDDVLVASMVMDVTQSVPPRLECYGKLTKDGMKVPLNDLEMEDLDFVIDGQLYLVTS